MSGVTHDGWYNPWDELNKPEVKKAYDEAVATGGFAYRTGYTILRPATVRINEDWTVTSEFQKPLHVGDGIRIVRFAPSANGGES